MRIPRFYKWGGGGVPMQWSYGWQTGKNNDLVCVKPRVEDELEGEKALSPACYSRTMAFVAFVLKAILVRIDTNVVASEG